jgi:predicted RNA-binding Zn ribbon-like protein
VLSRRRLRFREGRFVTEWADARSDLASVLWPVVLSAQALLCTADCSRVKACSPPDGCGWLYYDSSRNRSRRWCSMQSCGNAAKARSYYARSIAGRR